MQFLKGLFGAVPETATEFATELAQSHAPLQTQLQVDPDAIRVLVIPYKSDAEVAWTLIPATLDEARLAICSLVGADGPQWCVYLVSTDDRFLYWHNIGNIDKSQRNESASSRVGRDIYGPCVVVRRDESGKFISAAIEASTAPVLPQSEPSTPKRAKVEGVPEEPSCQDNNTPCTPPPDTSSSPPPRRRSTRNRRRVLQ